MSPLFQPEHDRAQGSLRQLARCRLFVWRRHLHELLAETTLDLLDEAESLVEPGALAATARLAKPIFCEQLRKGGVDRFADTRSERADHAPLASGSGLL